MKRIRLIKKTRANNPATCMNCSKNIFSGDMVGTSHDGQRAFIICLACLNDLIGRRTAERVENGKNFIIREEK